MIILYPALLVCCLTYSQAYCPVELNKTHPVAKVHFTNTSASTVKGCQGQFLVIFCCMEGYAHVRWEQQRLHHREWKEFLWYGMGRELGGDDNQSALLTDPSPIDGGQYRCTGYGRSSEDQISHTINVTIQDDLSSNKPPIPFTPHDDITYIEYPMSSTANMRCRANYGNSCNNQGPDNFVMRWESLTHGVNISEGNSSQHVYYITNMELDGSALDSYLYINGITRSDYGDYICHMENKHGSTIRTFVLQQTHVTSIVKDLIYYLTVVVLCSIIGGLAIIFLMAWRWKPEIKLFCGDQKQKLLRRERKYDLMIYDIDDDISNYICDKLREDGFKAVNRRSIQYATDETSEALAMAKESNRIIVILSPEVFQQNLDGTSYQFGLTKITTYRCIFVLHNIHQEKGCPWRNGLAFDNTDVRSFVDEKVWSAIQYRCKIQWPRQHADAEEETKFWSDLKRLLPKKPVSQKYENQEQE